MVVVCLLARAVAAISGMSTMAHHLGFLHSRTAAQVRPVNVWTQFFAADFTVGDTLNNRAMLRRDFPVWVFPLPNGGFCYAERSSECALRPHDARCFFDWMCHTRKTSISSPQWQALLAPRV